MKIRVIKKGLPKAQIGIGNISETLANMFGTSTSLVNPEGVKDYFGRMGRTDYRADTQAVADSKLQQQYPTLGATPQQQATQNTFATQTTLGAAPVKKKPLFSDKTINTANKVSDWSDALLATGAVVDYFGQDKKINDAKSAFRRNQFDDVALSPMFRGNYNINTGRFRDDVTRKPNEGMFQMGGEENFANTSNMIKIRITGKPENLEYAYGGQSGYGLDLHQDARYNDMQQSKADSVRNTIPEVPRNQANIEAEKGETVYGDLDGDGGLEQMKIGGKRHSQGGTPLNVPEGSFIFSDTAKMKIKDPNVLKYFGLPAKKGGYTPAEIAKRYDINKYKAIIEDENADEMSKNTAQLMVKNYEKKLAYLSMVQESMKGYPQGTPKVAEEYMGEEEQLDQAEYGGSLPEYQTKGQVNNRVAVWDDEEQKALQEYMKKKYNVEIPINARDTDPNSQRFTLPSMQTSRGGKRVYGDEDWTAANNIADFAKRQKKFLAENPNWDPTKVGATEKFQRWYDTQRKAKGMNPYFEKGQKFQKYDDKFGEYTFSAPDLEPTEPEKEILPDSPIGYICLGLKEDGLPNIQSSSYKDEAARSAAGAYASSQEAAMHCPGETIPGKIPTGEKPVEQKPGFLTPDKLSLLTAGLIPPRAYTPSVAELPYRQGDLVLEDWLSKAQQRQQTYNTSASTLGQFQPGTALTSNLSFLQGQTGEGVTQDIAGVDSRNVDRANQYMSQELQRRSMNDMYNTSARDRRYDGMTIAKQNLDNSRRKYLSGITKATNNMWANRMYLDMLNKVNPMFNVDPKSGLSYYKSGYDTSKLGSGSQGSMPSMQNFSAFKNKFLGYGMSEANAEKEALAQVRGDRTTYTDSDNDGIPNSSRTSTYRPNPADYRALNFNLAGSMYGGQIGPWTKKKKK
jgi:hypothetical protein